MKKNVNKVDETVCRYCGYKLEGDAIGNLHPECLAKEVDLDDVVKNMKVIPFRELGRKKI